MSPRAVRLYHSTDDVGKAGIEQHGFARSVTPDLPGRSCFTPTKSHPLTERQGWWVVVDIPNAEAESYQFRYSDGRVDPYTFAIPFDAINQYQADFIFEPADPER
jgi:hypothetical protein